MSDDKTALMERFMSRVEVDEQSGCWVWTGTRNQEGYGRCKHPELGRVVVAHRVSWWLQGRPEVPQGMQLDHTCRNRACTNPHHLEVVTPGENVRRAFAVNGRRSRPKCGRGHDLTDGSANLYVKPSGARQCMACARIYRTKHNHKMRAANAARKAAA